MKWALAFLFMVLLLSQPCYSASDSIVISIEIAELDCTAFPDRFDEYRKISKNEEAPQKRMNILDELEKKVPKKLILQHSQNTEVGEKVNQTTQFNDSKFRLRLSTEQGEKGLIHAELDFAISEGEEKQRAVNTNIGVKLGESVLLGGMAKVTKIEKDDGTEEETRCILIIRFEIQKNG